MELPDPPCAKPEAIKVLDPLALIETVAAPPALPLAAVSVGDAARAKPAAPPVALEYSLNWLAPVASAAVR